MVQIVHLAPGKRPPEAERFILIESCSPGGRTTVAHSGAGIVVKVPAPFLRTEINEFCRMADDAGITKLYVRGAPQELQAEPPPLTLSPWAA
jgi:hypothetical protein